MVTDSVVRLEFRSHFDMLDFVQVVSDEMGRLVGLDSDSTHWVSMAVRESVINAIKHGNRMSPDKSVDIKCWISDERVRIEIQDEGQGFDRTEVPDPTLLENLERPCGRGIMLMGAFMNLIEYNDQGNKVTLEKIKGVAPEQPESETE